MNQRLRALLSSIGMAVVLASCGGGGGGTTPTTPTPTAPTVTAITVTGPSASARPGDSSQFSATAVMSNSTTQIVTSQASWQSSNVNVATASSTGFVTAVGAGEADIRATYQSVSGSAHITVTTPTPPAPTFSVCGTVKEEGTGGPISGAVVIVKDTALATTSDGTGTYCITLPGGGRIVLRATRSGYELTEVTVSVSGNARQDISMRKSSSPAPTPSPTPAPSPSPSPDPVGDICNAAAYPSSASCGIPSAVCNDGTLSCSQNRSGTCSTHGGKKCWLCPGALCNGLTGPLPPLDYTPVPLSNSAPSLGWERR